MPNARSSSRRRSGRPLPPPSRAQLAYLRALARRTNTSFATPQTIAEASAEINRMLGLPGASAVDSSDARRERRAIREDLQNGYATAPDDEEILGWGSSAQWRTTR